MEIVPRLYKHISGCRIPCPAGREGCVEVSVPLTAPNGVSHLSLVANNGQQRSSTQQSSRH